MERVYQVVKVLCRETIRPCVKQVGYCVTEDNTKDQDSFHVVKVMISLLLCAHFFLPKCSVCMILSWYRMKHNVPSKGSKRKDESSKSSHGWFELRKRQALNLCLLFLFNDPRVAAVCSKHIRAFLLSKTAIFYASVQRKAISNTNHRRFALLNGQKLAVLTKKTGGNESTQILS